MQRQRKQTIKQKLNQTNNTLIIQNQNSQLNKPKISQQVEGYDNITTQVEVQKTYQNSYGLQILQEQKRVTYINQFNPQAAKRMLSNIKITEKRITEMKKQCQPYCNCTTCSENGFTRNVVLKNMDQSIWSGNVLSQPNSSVYKMQKETLTFRKFCGIALAHDMTKIKYSIDKEMHLPIIKITHLNDKEEKVTRICANRKDIQAIFVQIILAFLCVKYRYWCPYKSTDTIEGDIYKRYSFNGSWQKKRIRIQKSIVKNQKSQPITIKSPDIWTNFIKMQWDQVPYLIFKVWEGIWKVQYGLPISKISQWITAFISLIQFT